MVARFRASTPTSIKETAMSNNKLIPKLRFPEFRGKGEWEDAKLSTHVDLVSGVHLSPDEYDIHGEVPYFTGPSDFTNEMHSISKWTSMTASAARANDTLITVKGSGVGELWFLTLPTVAMGRQLMAVRAKHQTSRFIYQFLSTKRSRFEDLASGNLIPGLSRGDVLDMVAPFPEPAEQQKIADCLSSLDELIVAERRNLAHLQAYKSGLMQQLFPRNGETTPRLRFPEFRKAGEWAAQELGPKTLKVGSGITPTGGEKVYKKSGRPFIRSQNVGWRELLLDDVAYITEETHQSFDGTELHVDDVLLNITGASIGRSAIADSRILGGNVNQHVCIIRVKPDELNPVLLNQYLVSNDGQKQIDSFQAGGNRQGLNFAQIRSFLVPLPPTAEEQIRIAECLSALDTRIAAQSERLAALRTHKKGLMQQLFPSAEERKQ
jgi:type I restriction enzyme, S subunit